MLHALLILTVLAILPQGVHVPKANPSRSPFDYSTQRFNFFRDARPDGPLPSTHRLIFHRHYFYDANGNRVEQYIPVYNNSHFYWDIGNAGYCRIHAVKMHGRYEIEKITTWDMKPIKPYSLRKPNEDDDDEADSDG